MVAISEHPTLPDGVAAQHGHLAASIRGLRVRQSQGASWDELAIGFDRLLDDIRAHFGDEEKLMELNHYPRVAEHRHQHEVFRKKVEALRLECDRGKSEIFDVLLEMLETWFRNHEQTADRDVTAFLPDDG